MGPMGYNYAHIIYRMLNISIVTPSNLIYSVLLGRSWMAPWICSTPDSKLIQRSSCDAEFLLRYVRTYIYIYIYPIQRWCFGFLVITKPEFPSRFCSSSEWSTLSSPFHKPRLAVKKMPKFVWRLNPVGLEWVSIQMDWKMKDSNMLHLGCKVGYWISLDFGWLGLKVRVFFWLIHTEINSLNIPQCLWNKLLTWWCFSSSREDTWWLMVVSN